MAYDLPAGAKRMVMPSRGVLYTIVNGECVFADGKLTEAPAGEVLRSGTGIAYDRIGISGRRLS